MLCNFFFFETLHVMLACWLSKLFVVQSDILLIMRPLQPCIPVGLEDICEERTPHVSFILK